MGDGFVLKESSGHAPQCPLLEREVLQYANKKNRNVNHIVPTFNEQIILALVKSNTFWDDANEKI